MSVENIYYVDRKDNPTGEIEEKLKAHNDNTQLHAAFSCYVFNKEGQFLVTQRAHTKKVWHGVWTNSCCGHPKPGESREDAVHRRLEYKLGIKVKALQVIVSEYTYKTPSYNGIIEHEYCPIYIAMADESSVTPNPEEVEDYKWVDWEWYVSQLKNDSDDYSIFTESIPKDSELGHPHIPKWSWWCKDQLKHLESNDKFINYTSL